MLVAKEVEEEMEEEDLISYSCFIIFIPDVMRLFSLFSIEDDDPSCSSPLSLTSVSFSMN